MATTVSSSTAAPPLATPSATASGTNQTRAAGSESPFQTVLVATQTQQANATNPTGAATAPAEQDAVTEAAGLETEVDTDTETETDFPLDASLAGLLGLATQVLAPFENAAVAQAVGQTGQTAATTPAAVTQTSTPVLDPATRSRADQLRLDRGNGFVSPTAAATTNATNPTAVNLPQTAVPATPAPETANAAATTAVPVAANEQPATPAASAARVAASVRGGTSIPAQPPIVVNVVPNVPVPADMSVANPPVAEPTAAVAATALPTAQLGDRPAMAGERFVADAEAGARLAVTPPRSVMFANTLAQEVTAPTGSVVQTAPAAPVAQAGPTTPAGQIDPTAVPAESVTPVAVQGARPTARVGAANTGETTPATFGAFGGFGTTAVPAAPVNVDLPTANVTQPAAFSLPTGTEVSFGPLTTEAAPRPVESARDLEPRASDDTTETLPGTTQVAAGPQFQAAPRGTVEANAVQATPAAQIADSIVSHARVIERDGGVEFQMRLDPPELGRLQIKLVTRGDEIHGQVLVADEAVRAKIESQLPELRQRLEAAGVSVQQFDVATDPGTGGGRNPYHETASEFFPRAAPAPLAPTPRARVGRPGPGSLDVTV